MSQRFSSPLAKDILLIIAYSSILLGAFILFNFNSPYYYWLAAEDGFIENLTALSLFATALLCAIRAFKAEKTPAAVFYIFACLLFIFGGGEEISWGQRLFGFSTPEALLPYNEQGEFTVHNLKLFGLRFNKLIFGVVLYWSLFAYFWLIPFLYRKNASFRSLAESLQFPVPKWRNSICYTLTFLLLLQIPKENHEWEFQELMLSAYLFISFLYPYTPAESQQLRPSPSYARLQVVSKED